MAVETLDVQTVERATGVIVDLQTVTTANGFRFLNNGRTMLYVANDAGALVLGFELQPDVDGVTETNVKTVTQDASEVWIMGPFPTRWYNDANGYCEVQIDADLTAAALEGVCPFLLPAM